MWHASWIWNRIEIMNIETRRMGPRQPWDHLNDIEHPEAERPGIILFGCIFYAGLFVLGFVIGR